VEQCRGLLLPPIFASGVIAWRGKTLSRDENKGKMVDERVAVARRGHFVADDETSGSENNS
jgi:hypothetical protein